MVALETILLVPGCMTKHTMEGGSRTARLRLVKTRLRWRGGAFGRKGCQLFDGWIGRNPSSSRRRDQGSVAVRSRLRSERYGRLSLPTAQIVDLDRSFSRSTVWHRGVL